jgi:hypothetical protein
MKGDNKEIHNSKPCYVIQRRIEKINGGEPGNIFQTEVQGNVLRGGNRD